MTSSQLSALPPWCSKQSWWWWSALKQYFAITYSPTATVTQWYLKMYLYTFLKMRIACKHSTMVVISEPNERKIIQLNWSGLRGKINRSLVLAHFMHVWCSKEWLQGINSLKEFYCKGQPYKALTEDIWVRCHRRKIADVYTNIKK